VVSLAIIWTLRQLSAEHPVTMRAAYYRGMYPLVPFVLVGLRAVLQLLPFVLGSVLFNIVSSYGIAANWFELLLWGAGAILLAGWSVYMLFPSLIGLYIVTLPDMTPLKAVRSARGLVRYRRWDILRKCLLLILVLLLGLGVVMLPVIMFAASAAAWAFFGATLVLCPVIYAFGYELYRELINHA
jgi:hypothetical protein